MREEEEELANKIAYETKEELKKEEHDLIEAKSKLKTFLLSNEVRINILSANIVGNYQAGCFPRGAALGILWKLCASLFQDSTHFFLLKRLA